MCYFLFSTREPLEQQPTGWSTWLSHANSISHLQQELPGFVPSVDKKNHFFWTRQISQWGISHRQHGLSVETFLPMHLQHTHAFEVSTLGPDNSSLLLAAPLTLVDWVRGSVIPHPFLRLCVFVSIRTFWKAMVASAAAPKVSRRALRSTIPQVSFARSLHIFVDRSDVSLVAEVFLQNRFGVNKILWECDLWLGRWDEGNVEPMSSWRGSYRNLGRVKNLRDL